MTSIREGEYMDYLVKYIERNTAKGHSRDNLFMGMEKLGYSRTAIQRAFKLYEERQRAKQPAKQTEEKPRVEFVEEEPRRKGILGWLFGRK